MNLDRQGLLLAISPETTTPIVWEAKRVEKGQHGGRTPTRSSPIINALEVMGPPINELDEFLRVDVAGG